MPTREESQKWLDEFARSRGYAHRLYRVLANYDLDTLNAFNPVPNATYVDDRLLPKGQKELMLVVAFTCMRVPRYILQSHLRKALSFGVSARELLEALELCVFEAGRATFEAGLEAWAGVVAEQAHQPDTIPQGEGTPMAATSDEDKQSSGKTVPKIPTRAYEAILAEHDPKIGELIDSVPQEVYLRQRTLDPKTKELICVVMMTALKVPDYLLKAHIKRALDLGVDERELLEALEMIITVVGLPSFEYGLTAWADVVGAEELHPEGAIFTRLS